MTDTDLSVPAHVPPELVYDYDFFTTPAEYASPQWDLSRRLFTEAPPVFFTPRNGGHWVVTRRADAMEMLRDHERFPNDPQYNWFRAQNPMRFLPKDYDPPEHGELRSIIAPVFTVGAVRRLEPSIRTTAVDLIEEVLANGGCEFVTEIAERYPVTVFLRMADARLELREEMLFHSHRFFRDKDPAVARAAMGALGEILGSLIDERRANPGEDLLSRIVAGEVSGRPLTDDEILGGAVFTFLAGLDTVASMISFVMKYLALDAGSYARLVEDPALIPAATDELIRVSGVAMPERGVRDDVVRNGVPFRRNDRVVFLIQISGMDPDAVDDPARVDFDRDVKPHLVFSTGPHHCLGANLTRTEIRVFLEEWVRRVPRFGVADGVDVAVRGGTVWIPEELPLTWGNPAA